jgi:uncharacterized protein YneF (UPF0154 family)
MLRDWKSTLAVMLVFALGVAAGLFLGFIIMRQHVNAALRRDSPAYEQLLERRLSRGLRLDDSQRARFHETLMANIEQRKQLQKQLQPQIQALNLETARELRSIFTPQQLATFRQNLEDFRRRFGAPGLGGGRALDPVADSTNNVMPIGSTNAVPGAN